MRIGILGGTFNPPHLGHLVCAQEAYVQLELDEVTLIPTHIPPHKALDQDPGPEHRLELCRLAVEGDDRFTVSDLEIKREGPSYTVDTLEELRTRRPDSELFLILGGDIAAGLAEWRAPGQVLKLATPGIAERQGTSRESVTAALQAVEGGERARFFQMPVIGVSSTMIRERVRDRRPVRYLVPDSVITYIERHRLYRGSP